MRRDSLQGDLSLTLEHEVSHKTACDQQMSDKLGGDQ